ncbi:MAG: hypothetical protein WCS35_07100 [Sphaerochaeta sp.]
MKTSNKSIAFFAIVLVLVLLGCELSEDEVYKIGDTGPSGVGIVFYITDGGLHGLESAPALWTGGTGDPDAEWSNMSVVIGANAGGTAIGTGLTNSDAIITQEGHLSSGASLCRNYTGGLKTDWFLPSQDELNQLYLHKDTIGGLDAGQYWSSTEGYSDVENLSTKAKTACFQIFSTGTKNNGGYKNAASALSGGIPDFTGNLIRPIRAF